MGKESGKKVLLQVEKEGSPGEFVTLGGQKDTRLSMQGSPVDTSDKTSDNWGSTIAGTINATLTCSGQPNWGSTAQLDQIREAFESGDVLNYKFVVNETGDAYIGECSVTGFDLGGANDDATAYNITLQNSGPLVWTPGV
ncbi:MAG: phage tail tube protein [Alphaproteobacteria bacterium]